MSMPNDERLDLQELVTLIQQYCQESETGTLFLLTEESATVKLVIVEGVIVALSYQSIRGQDAILPISQLRHCKVRYYAGVKLLPTNQSLPETDEILDQLLGNRETSSSTVDGTQFQVDEPNNSETKETLNRSLEVVLKILVDETTEYLGPFAAVLCKKHMGQVSDPPTQTQIHKVLSQLAEDIQDESKSMQLEQKVLQRIQ